MERNLMVRNHNGEGSLLSLGYRSSSKIFQRLQRPVHIMEGHVLTPSLFIYLFTYLLIIKLCFVYVALRIESRTSYKLDKHSKTKLIPSPYLKIYMLILFKKYHPQGMKTS